MVGEKGTGRWIRRSIGIATFAVMAGITWVVWPRGTKVGTTAAFPSAGAPVLVALNAGDTLTFRLDATMRVQGYDDDDQDEAREKLRASSLEVVVTDEHGRVARVACPAHAGRSMSATTIGHELTLSGTLVACDVPITETGPYRVEGSVTPVAGLALSSVTLEVRRIRGGRR